MHLLRSLLVLMGFLVSATATLRAQKSGDADSQLWSETRLVYKLSDQLAIFTAGSYRLTKDFSDFSRASARFGGTWAATPSFSISPSYYYTVGDPWTSNPHTENRACLLLSYRIPVKTALLTLSNTTEYRMPEGGPDVFYLRPRIRLAHPVGPAAWGLNAFVANELFYNNGRGVFTQDRSFAGFEEKFNETLTMSLYYCRRTAMNTTSSDANAICVDFAIAFGRKNDNPPEVQFR
jgi:hypothetical protein